MKKFIPIYANNTMELAEMLTKLSNELAEEGYTYERIEIIKAEKAKSFFKLKDGTMCRATTVDAIAIFEEK